MFLRSCLAGREVGLEAPWEQSGTRVLDMNVHAEGLHSAWRHGGCACVCAA